jgi:1-acyl-sn-glycerol-3-phosphate acyltransferase
MPELPANITASNSPVEPGIYSMHKYIYVMQSFFRVTGRLVGLLFLRHRTSDFAVGDVKPTLRYVLAANHQTYLDPWVVPGCIPNAAWRKMGRPRAFVANRFFDYPFVGNLLRSIGAFPAKQHATDPFGLDYAISLLDRGQSVIIFPEGHIARQRQWGARKGVMVLAREPNVRIVPVHIEWRLAGLRTSFDIRIGKPFDGSKMTAQQILDRVYSLPVK